MFSKSYSNSAFTEQRLPKFCPFPARKQKVGGRRKMEKQQRDLLSYPFKKYMWHTCYIVSGAILSVRGTNYLVLAFKRILLMIIITAANTWTMLTQARPVLSALHRLAHSALTTALWDRYYHYPYLTDPQKSEVIHPRSHTQVRVRSGSAPKQPGSISHRAFTSYTLAVAECRP